MGYYAAVSKMQAFRARWHLEKPLKFKHYRNTEMVLLVPIEGCHFEETLIFHQSLENRVSCEPCQLVEVIYSNKL